LATWFGMQAGAAGPGRRWWTLGAVAASVTAAGVPAYEQIRKERMRAKAQRAAVDAAVAMRVTMNDALHRHPPGVIMSSPGTLPFHGGFASGTGRERWFSGGRTSGRSELVPLVGGEAVVPGDRVPEGGECPLGVGRPALWDV
jgi:hypothetical protein